MSNETTSRRRLGPRDDYAVVPVCCTGRGGHRLHRFGKARVYPDGRRWQLDGVAGTSTGSRDGTSWEHRVLSCPYCHRETQIKGDNLHAALRAIVGMKAHHLDISLLPF